jgi:hypothetical protein
VFLFLASVSCHSRAGGNPEKARTREKKPELKFWSRLAFLDSRLRGNDEIVNKVVLTSNSS